MPIDESTAKAVRRSGELLGIVDERISAAGAVEADIAVPPYAMRLGSVHGAAVAAYVAYGGRRLAAQLERGGASVSLESCKVHHVRPLAHTHARLAARPVVRSGERIVAAVELRAEKLVAFGWSSWTAALPLAGDAPTRPEVGVGAGGTWRETLGIELVARSDHESTVVQSSACSADPERWASLLTMVDCAALSLNIPDAAPKIVTAELGIVCGGAAPRTAATSAVGAIVQAGRRLVFSTSTVAVEAEPVAYGSATFAVL